MKRMQMEVHLKSERNGLRMYLPSDSVHSVSMDSVCQIFKRNHPGSSGVH